MGSEKTISTTDNSEIGYVLQLDFKFTDEAKILNEFSILSWG